MSRRIGCRRAVGRRDCRSPIRAPNECTTARPACSIPGPNKPCSTGCKCRSCGRGQEQARHPGSLKCGGRHRFGFRLSRTCLCHAVRPSKPTPASSLSLTKLRPCDWRTAHRPAAASDIGSSKLEQPARHLIRAEFAATSKPRTPRCGRCDGRAQMLAEKPRKSVVQVECQMGPASAALIRPIAVVGKMRWPMLPFCCFDSRPSCGNRLDAIVPAAQVIMS